MPGENEGLLKAKIADLLRLAERTGQPRFLGFLSEEEAGFAEKHTLKNRDNYLFYGGYSDAERVFLGVFQEVPDLAELYEKFPICPLTFTYRIQDTLSHRDFLGALMALGIRRETVGDILISPGKAVIFVSEEISGFILSQLETVGRSGVGITPGFPDDFQIIREFTEIRETVAGDRLDCIVAALLKISRERSGELISRGSVKLAGKITEKLPARVREGDTLTILSKGKFIIDSLSGVTKKGRTIMLARKYK